MEAMGKIIDHSPGALGDGEGEEKFNDQITFPCLHKHKAIMRAAARRKGSTLAQLSREAIIEYIERHHLDDLGGR